jgi:diguanylate cyclase (GGDEF)-like protein
MLRPLTEIIVPGSPPAGLALAVAVVLLAPVPIAAWVHRRYRSATEVSEAMRALSRFDTLTGVLNRQALTTWTGLQRRPVDALGSPCVLFLDIDRFKHVNDTHGHHVGDGLLIEVAARISATVRAGDSVVRMGGDEFVVLCEDVVSAAAAERLAMRLKKAIEEPIVVGSERIKISATIGIAVADRPGLDLERLIHEADCAMYRSKGEGQGEIVIADRSAEATPLITEVELEHALERGEFVLHYQPLMRLDDERMIGVEALLRWQHPERGLMPPALFVPLLEESGLIVSVGAWVLEQAATQARIWERRVGPERAPHVSVNVSPRQLNQADFTSVARDAIRRSGVNPRNLWLEITEGALLRDPGAAWASLRQLKSLGVSLALDDFGTGFSSLSYIRRFDLDVLKIDRSFVTGLHESTEDRAIVEHVIGLAHALGMSAVAEGVEEVAQADVLRDLGCDAVQGYWYGRPVPPEEIDLFLDAMSSLVDDDPRSRLSARLAV